MKKKRRFTMVELPPDLQAWLDDATDRIKYPLTPGKSSIMIAALRAYIPMNAQYKLPRAKKR
jgi:hypothetical protein